MKKIVTLLLIVFLISGCSIIDKEALKVERIDNLDYKQITDKVLSLDIKNYNTVGRSYKYYLPKGVVRISENEYNDELKRNNNIYYLYIEVVSYYYKTKINYKENKNIYYSKKLNYNNKKGYIEIKKYKQDLLFVKMVYNYGKIETYVKEKDLIQTCEDLSYILSSIKYNKATLDDMYNNKKLSSKSESYKLFDTKEKEGNFLEYVQEYGKYNETNSKEDEIITIETTTSSIKKEETKEEKETTTTTTTLNSKQ